MSEVKELFLNLTKTTMPAGNEHLAEKYLPKGWKKDFHGNYYIKIGDDPTVMFTSHLDTADNGQPKDVNHVIEGKMVKTDGKTILGADDKAGTAVMIYMIKKNKPGLYYFFLSEERGCVGSRALNTHLNSNREDPLYKNINKVVSLDRRDYNSVITYQVSERCCSDEFADELAKRLNEAGGFKYKKDPTGSVTDSHQVAEKFPECTNLSVGYDDQHTVREKQDVEFLQKLADACCKIDWETLPVKRDPTKTEYSYSKRSYYSSSNAKWDDDRWWENDRRATSRSTGPASLSKDTRFVTDYLGNEIAVKDAIWCEYDKAWCLKDEAIWVDYVGFYTTPDFDPSKVKPKNKNIESQTGLSEIDLDNLKVYMDIFSKDNKPFGKVTEIDILSQNPRIIVETEHGSKFIMAPDKFMTYGFKYKATGGGKKLTNDDLKIGLIVKHPIFGEGKIIEIRSDNVIAKISFKNKGEKDIRIDVANMEF